ncbi:MULTISPECIES: molybdate ABC transporter substrate-binding protein [unclassified Sulfuricurvum]|uniref:molybdate ABC transporter substrate-binding protein n=1 Tax=unclassified Sulfuricurvum TaxID=2632390 RepID=UPI000A53EFD7|nr:MULTISPECIES: molybdate ABC transporter substrate-binding protein [unclassified Sulfuricurvum]
MKPFTHIVASLALSLSSLLAGEVNIAAAADMKYALGDIAKLYMKRHPETKINTMFGSSGKAFTQISNGAPYDIYYSADIDYPKKLKAAGKAVGDVKPYAIGRIVLWSNTIDTSKGMNTLLSPNIKKIAIANPEHAPYGRAAVAALKSYGIYEKIKDKLIYGENINQTAQYAQTKAADVAILALSISSSPALRDIPSFLIPKESHPELVQGYVLVKNNSEASAFISFFETKEANEILKKYGFVVQ